MKVLGLNIPINFSKIKPNKADISSITKIDVKENIIYNTKTRSALDIKKWRNALRAAENIINPYRSTLYNEIYEDILLDSHLTAVINSRKNKTLSKPFKICDKDGNEIPEKTRLFKTRWFYNFMNYSLDSIFWGYSLICFDDIVDDSYKEVELIPRVFVKPEFHIVVKTPSDVTGIDYREEPYHNWYIGVGHEYDLGLLNVVAPWVIYKRNVVAAWSDYSELFGMPIRIGKTNMKDLESRRSMETMLKQMGKAAYGLFDPETSLEFIETSNSDSFNVYNELINLCNKEISKAILGQTMTTEDGSSKSQAQVHQDVSDEYGEKDRRFIEFLINDDLIPRMVALGFDLKDCYFKFDYSDKLTLKDESELLVNILNTGKYDVDESYITEKYGIPVKQVLQQSPIIPQIKNIPLRDGGEKKLVNDSMGIIEDVKLFYGNTCCSHDIIVNEFKEPFTEEEASTLIEQIYKNIVNVWNLPNNIYAKTGDLLIKSIYRIFGGSLGELEFGSQDYNMVKALKDNIYIFSGAKTFQQVKEMSSYLTEEGRVLSFNDFKKKALSVFEDYNSNFLKTEYNTAISQSQAASQWLDIEKNKDILPYLQYQTVSDGRVRKSHQELDNIIRRVDDKFWNNYYPPNGWNCRCNVIQLSEATETDIKGFKQPDDVPDLFMMNAGKDKVIFSDKHPYFKVDKQYKEYADKNFGFSIPEE